MMATDELGVSAGVSAGVSGHPQPAACDLCRPCDHVRIGDFSFTQREAQALRLAAGGQTIEAIARDMRLRPSSLKQILTRVYERVGVGSRFEALVKVGLVKVVVD